MVIRDHRGRYLLAETSGHLIKVFGPDGTFLRTVGRRGAGPSEFRRITALASGPADSVYVLDYDNARFTVLDPELEIRREVLIDFPAGNDLVWMEGAGVFLHRAMIRTPALAGYPAHFLDLNGRITGSIGTAEPSLRPDIPFMDVRAIGKSRGGIAAWFAYPNRYELEEWSMDGRLLRTVSRPADWFPDWRRPGASGRGPDGRPQARIGRVFEAPNGLLWVVHLIADVDLPPSPIDAFGHVAVDYFDYFDTLVEVLDLERGLVVGRHRFRTVVGSYIEPGQVGGVRMGGVEYDDQGEPLFVVWELTPQMVR